MLTCLCDALYGEVGIATVKVLEHAGCEVVFEEGQTCCGQPPFNSGDWESARKIASHCLKVFGDSSDPIVSPSGSCAAMMRDGYATLFEGKGSVSSPCTSLRAPVFELSEFLVKELGLTAWPAAKGYPRKVAYHRACHGRALGLRGEAEALLAGIPELQLVSIENPEQCCGFGGAFCVTQGKLSSGIGIEKLRTLAESGAEEVASGDMGCLMHLEGLARKHGIELRLRHFAEILADAI